MAKIGSWYRIAKASWLYFSSLSELGEVVFYFILFLGLQMWHMKVPRLGVKSGAIAAGLYHSHSNARS